MEEGAKRMQEAFDTLKQKEKKLSDEAPKEIPKEGVPDPDEIKDDVAAIRAVASDMLDLVNTAQDMNGTKKRKHPSEPEYKPSS